MDIRYDEYLKKGTEKIVEIFSSSDVSEREREAVINAFSDELISNIGDTSKLNDCELLIYSVSLRYIDEYLSSILASNGVSYSEFDKAIKHCGREIEIVQLFGVRGWNLPKLNNADMDKCEKVLRSRQESTSISSKIQEEDRRIDGLLQTAQNELSTSVCDEALRLLEELSSDIEICKQKKLSVPTISNKDKKKIAKHLTEIRKVAEQKENLHKSMYEVDLRIHDILSMPKLSPKQWDEVVTLCQRQTALLTDCMKRQWPMPSLRHANTNELITKYKHYLHMNVLDKAISSSRSLLSGSKQYKVFFSNCTQLSNCIETCRKNNWAIPDFDNADPTCISEEVRAEKNQKDRVKKIKRYIYLVLAGVATVAILIMVSIVKYREGKVQIPFDSSYAKGESLSLIYEELEEAGFENIQKVADTSGWLDDNEVIAVSIDNQDSYSKDSYKEPDVSIVITYSSPDRIYVADILEGWKDTEYKDVIVKLEEAGFTNIVTTEIDTSDKENDQITAAIELNGLDFSNEHCYIPQNAPITISYYALKIGIGNDSVQFIGQDYEAVVASLEESGFANVQTEEICTGWAKGNTVIGVNINNADSYDSSQTFAPDVRIRVKYSSGNRIDISDVVKDWSTKQYSSLQSTLKSKGFTNVTVCEKVTDIKTLNQLVASVSINNQQFSKGDCFVQKSAPIVIEYYSLKITIGHKTSYFTENKEGYYSSVISLLKEMGFTNITVYRNNDLFNGWITKEGSIESISINGEDSFEDTASYNYNAPIVIVVNTFKEKGCEDITLIEQ